MNTQTTHRIDQTEQTEHRLASLERSSNRWRLAAIGCITLFAGVLIGGMGANSNQPAATDPKPDPKSVIGVAGTDDTIYRIHHDGSITYIRVPKGERTAKGYFSWGDVKIDANYKSRNLPQ